MPQIVEHTLYTFDELSDRAKERAREWWREGALDHNWWEFVYEDAATIATMLGINLRQKPVKLMNGSTRYDPCIWFSGFCSQGDGACFEGTYAYAKGAAKAIRSHAPEDIVLHAVADDLQAIQRRHFYKLEANVSHSGHYCHEHSTDIEVTHADTGNWWHAEKDDGIAEPLRDFMRWIYKRLEAEHDWQLADEQVDENIRINEYTFDEDGRRED